MDNAEALRALEYVQRYFDKRAIDYMDEQLEIIRAHLTDPGYVRVPVEPTAEMLIDGAKAARDWLSQPGPYPRSKAVYRAMLAAAKGESHGDA